MLNKPTTTAFKTLACAAIFASFIFAGCSSSEEKTESTESAPATTEVAPATSDTATATTDAVPGTATEKPVGTPN